MMYMISVSKKNGTLYYIGHDIKPVEDPQDVGTYFGDIRTMDKIIAAMRFVAESGTQIDACMYKPARAVKITD